MPKGFSEAEKQQIQIDLKDQGKKLFEQHGFKKTSVSLITESVGIAKGSFYIFYDSKEELFIDILEDIEDVIQNEMIEEISCSILPTPDLFKNLLKTRLRSAAEEPIIRLTLKADIIQQIWSKLPATRRDENVARDARFIESFLTHRPEAVVMFQHDSEKLAGIFRSLFFLILHKLEIGEQVYDQVLDFMVEACVDKLFHKE